MDFHRPLGEVLRQEGRLSEEKIRGAQEREAQGGPPLGVCLVDDGLLPEDRLASLLVQEYKLPQVNPLEKHVRREMLSLVPAHLAERFVLLPLLLKKNAGRRTVYVAMADPTNLEAIESIEFCTGASVKPLVGTISRIRKAIRRLYGKSAGREGGAEEAHREETREVEAPEAPLSEDAPGARQTVPTRRILQAITEILIEKEIVTKEELMSRVAGKPDGT
jgi:hypothetical protein